MGSLEREPTIPIESRTAYLEGYLDAVEKIRSVHKREKELREEDLYFALRISIKTLLLSGDVVALPKNLSCYPSLAKLLEQNAPTNEQGP